MILNQLAKKYPLVKFIKIIATKCIEKLPDSAVPMLICYKAGKLVFQINSLDKIIEFTLKNVETFLEEHSVFKVDLEKPKPQEC
jgi:ribonuclease HIII